MFFPEGCTNAGLPQASPAQQPRIPMDTPTSTRRCVFGHLVVVRGARSLSTPSRSCWNGVEIARSYFLTAVLVVLQANMNTTSCIPLSAGKAAQCEKRFFTHPGERRRFYSLKVLQIAWEEEGFRRIVWVYSINLRVRANPSGNIVLTTSSFFLYTVQLL